MSSTSASHRARKKKIGDPDQRSSSATANIFAVDDSGNAIRPAFPLVAFLWPAQGTTSQLILLLLVLLAVGLFRWTVGLWGYSGRDGQIEIQTVY